MYICSMKHEINEKYSRIFQQKDNSGWVLGECNWNSGTYGGTWTLHTNSGVLWNTGKMNLEQQGYFRRMSYHNAGYFITE